MSQSLTYNIIFSGTNLTKPVIDEVKAGLDSLRNTGNSNVPTVPNVTSQSNGNTQLTAPNMGNVAVEAEKTSAEIQKIGAAFQTSQNSAYTWASVTVPQVTRVKNGFNVLTQTNQQTGESFQQVFTYGTQSMNGITEATDRTTASMNRLKTGSMSAFNAIRMGASMTLFMSSMLISKNLTEANSQDAVTEATENFTLAVREHGRGSQEAQKALQQLEKAQRSYQAATQMSTVMAASMGLQLVGLGASIIQTIPKIEGLTASLKNLTLWQTISSAFSGPLGWAKLAAAVGVTGAVIGGGLWYANSMAQQQNSSVNNINVNVAVQNDAIGEYLQRHGAVVTQRIGG
jgi:hypothetical protein